MRGQLLRDDLARELTTAGVGEGALTALLCAARLECALADAGVATTGLAEVTAALADAYVRGVPVAAHGRRLQTVAALSVPATLEVAPAEGFAYYGLHPRLFQQLVDAALPMAPRRAVVIGIRTIGVALGAVVAAQLRARGTGVRQLSVRPAGHPYERRLVLSAAEARVVAEEAAHAAFLVVDEGPGHSGSSFLAVGEALRDAGAPESSISFLCSRSCDPRQLVAPDAEARWRRFRSFAPPRATVDPVAAGRWIGNGRWRSLFWGGDEARPPSWPATERAKFLDPDGSTWFKFEGFGPYGRAVRARYEALCEEGYVPGGAGADAGDGFTATPVVRGRPLSTRAVCPRLLDFIADYCAFRTRAFPASDFDLAALDEMVETNARLELPDLAASVGPLPLVRPVVPDSRMAPHEFVRAFDGRLFKMDSAADGDDHLMPGPTDIAWDLAGAIVEWDLSPADQHRLVRRYTRRSGDDPRSRLDVYLRAYALFRASYWRMAADSTQLQDPERSRLEAAYSRARSRLMQLVRGQQAAA